MNEYFSFLQDIRNVLTEGITLPNNLGSEWNGGISYFISTDPKYKNIKGNLGPNLWGDPTLKKVTKGFPVHFHGKYMGEWHLLQAGFVYVQKVEAEGFNNERKTSLWIFGEYEALKKMKQAILTAIKKYKVDFINVKVLYDFLPNKKVIDSLVKNKVDIVDDKGEVFSAFFAKFIEYDDYAPSEGSNKFSPSATLNKALRRPVGGKTVHPRWVYNELYFGDADSFEEDAKEGKYN